MKLDPIFPYGEHVHFTCDKCNNNIKVTTSTTSINPPHRLSSGGIKIKSPNTRETDYRDFAGVPSKLNATPTKDTNVVIAVRYFEEKQQQQPQQPSNISSQMNELNEIPQSKTNGKKRTNFSFKIEL